MEPLGEQLKCVTRLLPKKHPSLLVGLDLLNVLITISPTPTPLGSMDPTQIVICRFLKRKLYGLVSFVKPGVSLIKMLHALTSCMAFAIALFGPKPVVPLR